MPLVAYDRLYVGPRPPRVNLLEPGEILADARFGASLWRMRQATPDPIAAEAVFDASVRRMRQVRPAAMVATSALPIEVRRMRQVRPAAMIATSALSVGARRMRQVRPAAMVATSALSAAVTKLLPYAYDTFTATDGTSISARQMDIGGTWAIVSGGFDIQSNRMHGTALNDNIAVVDSGSADHDVFLTIRWGSLVNSSAWTAVGRRSDTANQWRAFTRNGTFQLVKLESGALTTVQTASVSLTINTDYTLRITCSGTSIVARLYTGTSVTGTLIATLSTTSAFNQTATGVGARAFINVVGDNLTGDNFTARKP